MNPFTWLNDTFLKMTWLNNLVRWFWRDIVQLPEGSTVHEVLSFFTYDVIKIFILLITLIYIVSYIQSYFTPERTRQILKPLKGIWGTMMGALLGTFTPFCSCSSIPIFIGFNKAGLPISMTFAFLISSPLVDLASVIILASVFGWWLALIYVVVGFGIAVLGGTFIQALHMEQDLAGFLKTPATNQVDTPMPTMTRRERFTYSFAQVKDIVHRVYPYVFIGVAIGALIHGVIPTAWIEALIGRDQWYAVPLATLVGVPMYADIFGTIPIAESLLAKGVGVGTILSFMMAVTALSLPSMVMLKKVMKYRLLFLFIGYLIISIITMGYFFNLIG